MSLIELFSNPEKFIHPYRNTTESLARIEKAGKILTAMYMLPDKNINIKFILESKNSLFHIINILEMIEEKHLDTEHAFEEEKKIIINSSNQEFDYKISQILGDLKKLRSEIEMGGKRLNDSVKTTTSFLDSWDKKQIDFTEFELILSKELNFYFDKIKRVIKVLYQEMVKNGIEVSKHVESLNLTPFNGTPEKKIAHTVKEFYEHIKSMLIAIYEKLREKRKIKNQITKIEEKNDEQLLNTEKLLNLEEKILVLQEMEAIQNQIPEQINYQREDDGCVIM